LCRMREQQLINVEEHVVTLLDFRGLHKLTQGRTDPEGVRP
jgi:hypothetical protein